MKSTGSTHLAERSERTTTETSEEAIGALHAEDNKKKRSKVEARLQLRRHGYCCLQWDFQPLWGRYTDFLSPRHVYTLEYTLLLLAGKRTSSSLEICLCIESTAKFRVFAEASRQQFQEMWVRLHVYEAGLWREVCSAQERKKRSRTPIRYFRKSRSEFEHSWGLSLSKIPNTGSWAIYCFLTSLAFRAP